MVKRERPPRITLARLHHDVGLSEGRREEMGFESPPMLFVAVCSSHIVQVLTNYILPTVPLITLFYKIHHARRVAVVERAEHP